MKTTASQSAFAVITGASSGIGYELAKQFAQNGYDILIVAEDAGIAQAAQRLQSFGAQVQDVQCDLAQQEGVEVLCQEISRIGRPIDAIAINAGVGVGGKFIDTSLEDELNMVNLNVVSAVCLAKHIVQTMVAQKKGGRILFTSSIAATMPGPYEAVYAATKAFIQSFAEALHYELKEKGITVTALMPGPTETNFFHRAGMDNTKVGAQEKDDPAVVARQGFEALMAGEISIIAGSTKTKLGNMANDLIPEGLKAQRHANMTKPGSAAGVREKEKETV